MASQSQLTCNFTITSPLNVAIVFQSDLDGNFGGTFTGGTGTGGPVSTSLWDSDGNVFFTLVDSESPDLACIINSGANPSTWAPFVEVGTEAGLTCNLSGPVQAGPDTYDYTLEVTRSAQPRAAEAEAATSEPTTSPQ
ncbi:MAG TPA: hypothetical protein VF718_01085 [Allosphingosinicella sp.]|jgi:hypothetical protein